MSDHSGDPARLDAWRTEADEEEVVRRAEADGDRHDRRAVSDQTRAHGRGDRQAHESLERERRAADASLDAERSRAAVQQRRERVRAEEALEDSERRRVDRDDALRRVMRRAGAELRLVAAQVEVILHASSTRGAGASAVRAGAEAIGAAVVRLQRQLQDVLDADDSSCREHDVGGSG